MQGWVWGIHEERAWDQEVSAWARVLALEKVWVWEVVEPDMVSGIDRDLDVVWDQVSDGALDGAWASVYQALGAAVEVAKAERARVVAGGLVAELV